MEKDLTQDDEEKIEFTLNEFIVDKDAKEVNLGSKEEMVHCIKYMKQLLQSKEEKYGTEIFTLKEQMNDLKNKLAEYLVKENGSSVSNLKVNKENSLEVHKIECCPQVQNDTFEMKKKAIGFSRQTIAHAIMNAQNKPLKGFPVDKLKNENRVFIIPP